MSNYDNFKLPEETRRPTNAMSDDLRAVVIANLKDNINTAWCGWEAACKFEDDGLQSYYMKYIHVLGQALEKIKRI